MKRRHIHFNITNSAPLTFCGEVIGREFSVQSYEKPFEIHPTQGEHSLANCDNCKNHLQEITNRLTDVFHGRAGKPPFPVCCDAHSQLLKYKQFSLPDYEKAPRQVALKIMYTYHHIINHIEAPDWQEQITDYIRWAITSLGHFPHGYGEPLLAGQYLHYVTGLVKNTSDIPEDRKQYVIAYLQSFKEPENKTQTDLQGLLKTYEKWVTLFPSNIELFFKGLHEKLKNQLPVFDSAPRKNIYSGAIEGRFVSKEMLVERLHSYTKALLNSINTPELYTTGAITNSQKHKLELLSEGHRVKQARLVGKFTAKEIEYIDILAKWLENEKAYFSEIGQISPPSPHIENKNEKLKSALMEHGFFTLPLVKALSQNKQQQLFELIVNNGLPYRIAIFDYLGFIKHLETNYFDSNKALLKNVSYWLNSDKDGRAVKGNLSTLNPKSSENKTKYTAHLHKEKVKKDYQNIK